MSAAALALVLSIVGPSAPAPELVVLPPKPGAGVAANVAIEAWREVMAELSAHKDRINVSLRLAAEAKDALLGPARDQAWECGTNTTCVRDLAATLGAAYVVYGAVETENVSLYLLDVAKEKKLSGSRSAPKLASESVKRRARAAAKGLVKILGKLTPSDRGEGTEKSGAPPPRARAPRDPTEAAIHIPALELTGGVEIAIDGAPVTPGADGSISWVGAPGSHAVTARRPDGATMKRDVFVAPKGTATVNLGLPPIDPKAPRSTGGAADPARGGKAEAGSGAKTEAGAKNAAGAAKGAAPRSEGKAGSKDEATAASAGAATKTGPAGAKGEAETASRTDSKTGGANATSDGEVAAKTDSKTSGAAAKTGGANADDERETSSKTDSKTGGAAANTDAKDRGKVAAKTDSKTGGAAAKAGDADGDAEAAPKTDSKTGAAAAKAGGAAGDGDAAPKTDSKTGGAAAKTGGEPKPGGPGAKTAGAKGDEPGRKGAASTTTGSGAAGSEQTPAIGGGATGQDASRDTAAADGARQKDPPPAQTRPTMNDSSAETQRDVASPSPPPATATRSEDQGTGWWVYAAVGLAVLAGGASAILLASGQLGGPSVEGPTGSITGTY